MYRFATTTAALLALSGATAASAAVIHSYEFETNGQAESWAANNNVSGFQVNGGSMKGTASGNDPFFTYAPDIDPTAGFTWTTVEYRFRRTDGGSGGTVQTTYDDNGTLLRINGSNSALTASGPDAEGFFTVTGDISAYGTNTLTFTRIDPIGGNDAIGDFIEIDYIRISDSSPIPEPGSLALLGLGGAMFLRRRR